MWKTIKRKSQRIGFPLRQRSAASSTTKSFHYLNYLGDDLILEILSFTSCGPLEMGPEPFSTLTHVFPHVCKHFNQLCQTSDMLWLHALTRLLYSNPLDFQMGLLKIVRSGRDRVVVPSWSTFYNPLKDRNDYILQSQVRNLSTLSPLEINQLLMDICQSLEIQCQAMESRCKALLESDYEEGCTWKEDLGGRFTFVKKNGSILCTPRLVNRILIRHSCSSSYYPVLVQPRIHISPGIPIHIRHLEKRYTTFFYDWIYEQNEVRTTRRARTLRKVVLLHDVHPKWLI